MEEYSSENWWKRVYKGRVVVQGAVVVLVKIGIRKVTKKAQFAQNQADGRDRGGGEGSLKLKALETGWGIGAGSGGCGS